MQLVLSSLGAFPTPSQQVIIVSPSDKNWSTVFHLHVNMWLNKQQLLTFQLGMLCICLCSWHHFMFLMANNSTPTSLSHSFEPGNPSPTVTR